VHRVSYSKWDIVTLPFMSLISVWRVSDIWFRKDIPLFGWSNWCHWVHVVKQCTKMKQVTWFSMYCQSSCNIYITILSTGLVLPVLREFPSPLPYFWSQLSIVGIVIAL